MDTLTDAVTRHKLVPVIVIDDASHAAGLGRALVAGGLPVAEVTFRTAAAAESIAAMASVEGLLVGAGTVRTPEQVDQALAAGARFVVSPGLSEKVVRHCQALGVPVFPGATTATEVQAAGELGLSIVKFFPAETSGGAAAIKALSAPFPDMQFIPTGGIGPKNLADYLGIGAVLACGGSWMCPRDALAAGDFATIEQLTRDAVALANA